MRFFLKERYRNRDNNVNKILSLNLEDIKERMLENILEDKIYFAVNSINKDKRRILGKFNPWVWCLEPVRGCNLTCWHCPARLLPKDNYTYMTKKNMD